MSLYRNFCLGSFFLLLAACGGGGGGGGGTTAVVDSEKPVLTGQFIDSAVSGVRYVTATRSGTTDSNGQFEYLEGETVSLYIGNQLLGDAPGAARISLFDLVDGVNPLVGHALSTTIEKLNENRSADGRRPPNFSTVINLAVLLQTLDKDGDPENGIDIAPEVAGLFTASNIDLNQHWEDFTHELGFRKALADAKSQGYLDSARQIRKSWRAMAHLYANLGIDSKLRPVTGSGNPDTVATNTFDDEGKLVRNVRGEGASTYTYDANGNQTRIDYDYDVDGTPDGFRSHTYDTDGNLTRMEIGGDVSRPALEIHNYDAYGNQTRVEKYNSMVIDYISNTTYDADGRPTSGDTDNYGDGTLDSRSTWIYHDGGYQIRSERKESVQPGVWIYDYDNEDFLLSRKVDGDSDGITDRSSFYTYDDRGRQIRIGEDRGGDGTIELVGTIAYDANDNVIREAWDYDNNGMPDRIETSSYDASRNLIRYEDDSDGDGIPERVSATHYEYDADGNWIRSEHDGNGDGTPESVGLSTYDANGNLVRRTSDFDLDGNPDSISTWEYAANTEGWWSLLQSSP